MLLSFQRRLSSYTQALACAVFLIFSHHLSAQTLSKSVVTTDQVRVELIAYAPEGAEVGKSIWLGLQLAHQPQWHTYWKNPGDSGLPTVLDWTLPPGIEAGEIAWPTPQTIRIGNLVNYGYEKTVLLPVPLQINPQYKSGLLANEMDVKLKASWLVCKTECIPQEGDFSLKVPLRGSTALYASAFKETLSKQPQAIAQAAKAELAGQTLKIAVTGLPASAQGQRLEVFPELADIIAPSAAWGQQWQGDVWSATLPLAPQRTLRPDKLTWVLATSDAGYHVQAAVSGTWPAELSPQEQAQQYQSAATSSLSTSISEPAGIGFVAAILGALLGGLILNLMPCVFPILAIKVLEFSRHAGDHTRHRTAGLAYSTGVVVSFVALGALMLVLRSAGEQLGWGFQLQSPLTVAGLALLFTLVGLNLAGVFQVGSLLPDRLMSLESRNPALNAFLSGVLAVLVASPCTAPFMGASLGAAIALPVASALSIFAALGLGMAAPYLLASLLPQTARVLPRPGPWMETLRRAMAFPMLATVVWLLWILGHQTGIDGAAALLAILLALAAVLWAAQWPGRAGKITTGCAIAVLALTIWALGPQVLRLSDAQADSPANASGQQPLWQSWAPDAAEQLLETHPAVFVDFTAAWCVTCQYNKQTTLSNADVLSTFKVKNIALLRADWTRRDPAISTALTHLGRSGVPVYVLYRRGKAPIVLPEVLSPGMLRAAMADMGL